MIIYDMVPVTLLAFFCELVDSCLGMGCGTKLTPIMLLLGFEPLEIVPAVICSVSNTGILAGFFHHESGNVDFRPGSRDINIKQVLVGFSVAGVLLATIIAVSLPSWIIKLYIGILVLALGLIILLGKHRDYKFSWNRIADLGWLAGLNRGITSLTEGITSIVGSCIYVQWCIPVIQSTYLADLRRSLVCPSLCLYRQPPSSREVYHDYQWNLDSLGRLFAGAVDDINPRRVGRNP